MPIAETITAITAGLTSLRPRKQPNTIGTSATTDLAKQLDVLLQELASDPSLNPTYLRDIEALLTSAVQLATQLANPTFNFDRVLTDYTSLQIIGARLLSHAAGSRPRINGWGLTHMDKVFPYFAMSSEEAGRMRDGMPGLPLNVVAVEIIHNAGFSPSAPISISAPLEPIPAPPVNDPPQQPAPPAGQTDVPGPVVEPPTPTSPAPPAGGQP